jgi:hypothetical protein
MREIESEDIKKDESALTIKSGVVLVLCASLISYIMFAIMNHNTRIAVIETRMENIAKIEGKLCEIDTKLGKMATDLAAQSSKERAR